MLDLSVIILTGNEELHIERCLHNVAGIAKDIFIVDSFSTDRTRGIVESFSERRGTRIQFVQHTWPGNQAGQMNWALKNLTIETEWVLRLDADEVLTDELKEELYLKMTEIPDDVNGIVFKRRHVFFGRWIKAGTYPVKLLRLFRRGKAACEQRMMDEHMFLIEGRAVEFEHDFIDHNLSNLSWWAQKHIGYAVREAADLLDLEYNFSGSDKSSERGSGQIGTQAAEKRIKKLRYAQLPLFWRAFAYFCFRYFVKGGWREGTEGFLWHFLQGFWYRLFVDAKIWEIKRKARIQCRLCSLKDPESPQIQREKDLRVEIIKLLNDEYSVKIM